jgi:hypothetical protein
MKVSTIALILILSTTTFSMSVAELTNASRNALSIIYVEQMVYHTEYGRFASKGELIAYMGMKSVSDEKASKRLDIVQNVQKHIVITAGDWSFKCNINGYQVEDENSKIIYVGKQKMIIEGV